MDHSKMGHATPKKDGGMDHSKMGHAMPKKDGEMDHSKMGHAMPKKDGEMDHSKMGHAMPKKDGEDGPLQDGPCHAEEGRRDGPFQDGPCHAGRTVRRHGAMAKGADPFYAPGSGLAPEAANGGKFLSYADLKAQNPLYADRPATREIKAGTDGQHGALHVVDERREV